MEEDRVLRVLWECICKLKTVAGVHVYVWCAPGMEVPYPIRHHAMLKSNAVETK